MDNYKSEWVLAQLKRTLVNTVRDKDEDYFLRESYTKALVLIATIEADAILGTPEMIEETVNKLLDAGLPGGDTDAVDPLDFSEVK